MQEREIKKRKWKNTIKRIKVTKIHMKQTTQMKLHRYLHNLHLCTKLMYDAGMEGGSSSRLMDERDLEDDFVT